MMENINQVQQGASEASPPACINNCDSGLAGLVAQSLYLYDIYYVIRT